MLVVEQNANIALDASARAYVLEVGQVAVEGTSDELRRHEGVRRVVPGLLMAASSCNRSSSGLAAGVDLREPRARARPHLPRDPRRQLRAGRDGDVHDLHRVVAHEPRLLVLAGVRAHARDRVRSAASRSSGPSSARSSTAPEIVIVIVTIGLLIAINGLRRLDLGRRDEGVRQPVPEPHVGHRRRRDLRPGRRHVRRVPR